MYCFFYLSLPIYLISVTKIYLLSLFLYPCDNYTFILGIFYWSIVYLHVCTDFD